MANVTRWEPFSEMLTLREAINGLFEESFVQPSSGRGQGMTMPLNVSETPNAFMVEAVVPGIRDEDLDITIQDNVLTITGETRQETSEGEKPHFHRIERRYGRVSRTVSFPMAVQADGVKATLENGILHLEVPKAETVKPRKISVTANRPAQMIDAEASEPVAA